MTRILLGQLGSNGDCFYATAIARQLKHDFPDCHLTWAISNLCRRVIDNNPHVDAVWEVDVPGWGEMRRVWPIFEQEAWQEVALGTFDQAYLTQVFPSHFCNFDGTVRPPLFRNFPHPITVPIDPVIRLTAEEEERVDEWAAAHKLSSFRKVVLCECSSKSGQSFVTPALMVEVARIVGETDPDIAFILSTHEAIDVDSPRVMHGGELTMRETARLTHHADMFVGCGSGLTVMSTSSAAKPSLPSMQILAASTSVFASFKHDFDHFGLSSDHYIETTVSDPERLAQMVLYALDEGPAACQARYGQTISPDFEHYFDLIDQMLIRPRHYVDAAQSLNVTIERYGPRPVLCAFAKAVVLPFLDLDPKAAFPRGRREGDRLAMLISRPVPAAEPPLRSPAEASETA
ncbi:glycosyltransferase family 9 protein [Methyloligella solikamskensis]|uniref:Glycosyltransferase family 9 protein n=1 Tax=Methyloligella solikamskensis TaxID=1177756 RepID=A0ABW3JAE8_9HYPH